MFLRLLALTALLSAAHSPARADATFIESAHPAVRAALLGDDDGEGAGEALDKIAANEEIDDTLIKEALAMPLFAPHALATLVALAKVDKVPGVRRTLERVVSAGDRGNVIGAAFEIQAAALLGSARVAKIGPELDGNEVDLLLFDGTRVEVKYQSNAQGVLAARIVRKASDQLHKRGAYGDPVMLIVNHPLSREDLIAFRRDVGPASTVLVVTDGELIEQLAPAAPRGVPRLQRTGVGRVRIEAGKGRVGVRRAARRANRSARARQRGRAHAKASRARAR